MSLIGSIEQFDPKSGDITSYLERLEQLFICNVVEDNKKVPLLLTLIGGETYNVLKDLVSPELPSTKSFADLKRALGDHYNPKRLVIAERYKFYNSNQESNEDIKSFVARLKKLTQYCNFGQFLSECLRDKLVCGLRSATIKRKLLSEDNLTFERAYEIAVSMELTEGQIKFMGAESSQLLVVEESLDKVSLKKKRSIDEKKVGKENQEREFSSGQIKPCFRCGRKHNPNTCPAKSWQCFKCKSVGHTSKVC